MANRLLSIIDIIDETIKTHPIKDIKCYGLCRQEYIREERQPVYFNGKNYEAVAFNDNSAISTYHRILSTSQSNNFNAGFGINSLKTEVYNIAMVVFGNINKIASESFDISYRLSDEIGGLIPNKLTNTEINSIEAQTASILTTGFNLDKKSVFDVELPDNKKYFIKPENILFSINYTISANYLQECKTIECE